MLEKNITFTPSFNFDENVMSFPKPASHFLPEWYKNMNSFSDPRYAEIQPSPNGHIPNLTVKRCMPFFDTMTSGYMVTLPADIVFVDPNEFGHRIIWSVSYDVVGPHSREQIKEMPVPIGYEEIFKWIFHFTIKTPPGYSCMFMQPNFRYDSPFVTVSGIVDTDRHPIPVNFPFFLKENFMGKIEKGTPICQIIPFKRESWKMEKGKFSEKNLSIFDNFHSVIDRSYKKRFWSRKSYK